MSLTLWDLRMLAIEPFGDWVRDQSFLSKLLGYVEEEEAVVTIWDDAALFGCWVWGVGGCEWID